MPILLVEGTRGAGKTTLGSLLAEEAGTGPAVNTGHAPIKFVPQRLTLGMVRPLHELGVLDDELARVLLGRLVSWVKRAGSGERWLVLDTVHLTMWVRGMLGPAAFAAVDDAFARLGTRGVLLRTSPEVIRARRDRDDERRCEGWMADQQTMLDLCGNSAIPWTILDGDPAPPLVLDAVRREFMHPVELEDIEPPEDAAQPTNAVQLTNALQPTNAAQPAVESVQPEDAAPPAAGQFGDAELDAWLDAGHPRDPGAE